MNRTAMHLVRRWWSSLSRRPPKTDDVAWVRNQFLAGEFELWNRMSRADRRHSIVVARRFTRARPDAVRDEISAALLHDIGKIDTSLGTFERVLATIVGPRTDRWRRYHDHELIGPELCRAAGSSALTLAILTDPDHPVARLIRIADDI